MNESLRPVTFDDSLPLFIAILLPILGKDRMEAGQVLRDASGRLAFIAHTPLSAHERDEAITAATARLPAYCRDGRTVLNPDQPGVSSIVRQARQSSESIPGADGELLHIRLLEQRIVGQDWLVAPTWGWRPPAPARFVFASLKGGVGRSTALAVVATELARQGRTVLVIDLDLEAPGIGAMLLNDQEQPRFGLLDGYVERGLGGNFNGEFLLDMVSPSAFGHGKGLIDVVPATGSRSQEHPANVLAKIARAYLESSGPDGEPVSFLAQTQKLVEDLSGLKRYDAILIDARVGLNETTAAAILGLGADVLLFGEATPQTFASYRFLLAHLARFPRLEEDWLYRLRMVHAKANADAPGQESFRDSAYEIFRELLYREQPLTDETGAPLLDKDSGAGLTIEEFSADDPEAPHFAWPVLRDSNYFQFDPLDKPALLTGALYQQTYGALLAGIMERMESAPGETL